MKEDNPWPDRTENFEVSTGFPVEHHEIYEKLTFMNELRKQLGEPYEIGIPIDSQRPELLGENQYDDREFKAVLKRAVTSTLDYEPLILYNPGCGQHVSLATTFPDTRTILVDESGDVEHEYLQHNIDEPDRMFEFYRANMHDFILPDNVLADVTLIFNAGYMTEAELDKVVADNGIVIVNEWHKAASYMWDNCPSYVFADRVDFGDKSNDLFVFKRKPRLAEKSSRYG